MIAAVRRALRTHVPEPVRLGVALARRTIGDRASGHWRHMAMRATAAPDGRSWPVAVEITQEMKKSPFWEGKVENIRLGAARLDGVVIAPGRIFSFWKLIGRPSSAAGFHLGRSIRGDTVGGDVGGGLCQLSGIIYEAGLRAGLEVLERLPHSRDLYAEDERFAPLGLDATVVWPYKDLRLRNPLAQPVAFTFVIEGFSLAAAVRMPQPVAPSRLDIRRTDGAGEREVRIYRVSPGGKTIPVSADRYRVEPQAASA
ncbi:VanW family protein [uncultured Sphingomonas sp.]|uniref:VanW family protein n=1 Tax=uncultured Sphingomonas sp. TaxID=158754 RepID=UPI0035CA67AA